MTNHQICPVCMSYMVTMDTLYMSGWSRCPSCNWCHDKNKENLYTKQLDSEGKTLEEKKQLIKQWRIK